jgi:hypothetical protein
MHQMAVLRKLTYIMGWCMASATLSLKWKNAMLHDKNGSDAYDQFNDDMRMKQTQIYILKGRGITSMHGIP